MKEIFNKINQLYTLFIKKYKKALIGLSLLLIAITSLGFTENLLNQFLIDDIIIENKFYLIFQFFLVYIILNIVCLGLSYIVGKWTLSISQRCGIDMRMYLMNRFHHAHMNEFGKQRASAYIVRMMEDVTTVVSFYTNTIIGNLISLFSVILMMIYIIYYSWMMAFLIFIYAVLQIFISSRFTKPLKQNQDVIKQVTQNHMNGLNDNIYNLPLIKTFSIGKKMLSNYKQGLMDIKKISFKNYDTEYILGAFLTLVGVVNDASVILLGCNGIKNGEMSVGALVILLSLSSSVRSMFTRLASANIALQQFSVSARRITEILNLKEESDLQEMDQVPITEISFEDVTFSYENSQVLSHVSFQLKCNKINVLFGESGKGKSTIGNLLLQLYTINQGKIMVNQNELDDELLLRRKTSVCFQDNQFVFESLYENLKYVDEDISDEKIWKVLQLVQADTFIHKLKEGIYSNVGEISKNFSGGELQRLALARTLLKKADVYVFDESFSSVGEDMRDCIFDNIVKYLQGKIIIVITHDRDFIQQHDANIIYIGEEMNDN